MRQKEQHRSPCCELHFFPPLIFAMLQMMCRRKSR